jgi:eukaryotic-like serine/threonine-protein kinase
MGIVYAAEDTRLRRRVALKVLPAGFAANSERRLRFVREARATSAITHPNIAAVYDVGEADGSVYIAMEYVEGTTLRSRIESGLLDPAEALRVAREIARGLSKAHAAGIVHRDLKPDNVMVGPDGLVKILDFGLAKPLGASQPRIDGTASQLATVDGRILGTPSYMSPEQARGRPVDTRSDIFSFGVMLYEMLSGHRPFVADTTMELLIAIDRDPAPPLSRWVKQLPRRLERVVLRCLEKSPEDRFATCAELVAALDEVRLGSGPGSMLRQRWLQVSAVLLVAAIFAGALWANARAQPASVDRSEAIDPESALSERSQPLSTSSAATVAPPAPPPEARPPPPVSPGRIPKSRAEPRVPVAKPPDPLADQK